MSKCVCNAGVGAAFPTSFRGRRIANFNRVLAVLVLAASAHAQEQPQDLTEVSLDDLAKIQVYSASKHYESASDAPSSVTVITSEEIQGFGYRTFADLLRSVRGFDVTYDRNFSYAGVRGINQPEDYNSRVLLLIDGQRTNNNIYQQAMLGTEFPLDLDLIDRVEIIRGPSSSLYGASAFFAVINVITRKTKQLTGWELSFEPASFDTYKGRVSYGGDYRRADIVLSSSFYDSQGQTLFYPEFNSPSTNNGIARNTDYDSYQHFLATVSYRGLTIDALYSDRNKGVPTGAFGTLFNDPRTHTFDSEREINLAYQHTVGEHWDVTARTSIGRHVYDGIYTYGPAVAGGADVLNYDFARGTWWSAEAKLQRTVQRHDFAFGMELQDDLQQDQGNFNIDPFLQYIASRPPSSYIYAVYGQDQFAITRKLSLSAGVRYDHYYNFGGSTNPRLGLIYHPFTQTTFKLLYGTAFRAPSAYEKYYYGQGLYQTDLDLLPETINSTEIVVERGLGQHFQLTGDVFRNQIAKLIVQVPNSSGLLIFENSGGARATGVETELHLRFASGLKGSASYSYSNVVETETRSPTISPQHLAKLNLIIPIPTTRQKLFAGLEGQYNGESETRAEHTVSGFQVFNLTLLGHAFRNHMDLSGSVYNLLDKKYFFTAPTGLPEDQLQQDGRSFRIKATARF